MQLDPRFTTNFDKNDYNFTNGIEFDRTKIKGMLLNARVFRPFEEYVPVLQDRGLNY